MICKNCNIDFPVKVKINGKTRNLSNRKYCLSCSPFGKHNTKKLKQDATPDKRLTRIQPCIICDKHNVKKICNSCRTKIRRHRLKEAAIKLLGNKCGDCGWIGNIVGFEFHHKNPKEKDFQIGSAANRKWEIVKKELTKCELLCSICHRIKHSDRDEKFLTAVKNYNGRKLE